MRVERRLALLARLGGHDLDEIELVHDQAQHETGEMVLGYEVLHRQRQRLIDLPGAECLAHKGRQNPTRLPPTSENRPLLRQAPSQPMPAYTSPRKELRFIEGLEFERKQSIEFGFISRVSLGEAS